VDVPMMTQEPAAPQGPGPEGADAPGDGNGTDDERLAPLRGAGVDIDTRRAARAVIAVTLAGLAVLTVVLFVAGFQKNAQQSSLAARGVPVTVTVTTCLAEMGGSGSNLAGYACTGTYTVDGRRYTESIPGNALHTAGSTVQGITVPGNPALLSTPDIVRSQKASWTVFIVPTLLLIVLVGSIALLLVRRRRAAP
jgi:hypothetical protein